MTSYDKEIVKLITGMSGRYSSYEIFADWIRCCAIAISNSCQFFHDKVWQDREQFYIDTMNKYRLEERMAFAEMFHLLVGSLEEDMTDALGEIYMSREMGSSVIGQFFTPFHLSKLTAALPLASESFDDDEIIHLNEPTCGAGGMIIAAAAALKKKGINYQKRMKVVAQDLDWRCVHMCYVQLSLLGIKAIVVQGDTLADPFIPGKTEASHILYTLAERGALL